MSGVVGGVSVIHSGEREAHAADDAMKRCQCCGADKPEREFRKRHDTGKRRSTCLGCEAQRRRVRYTASREQEERTMPSDRIGDARVPLAPWREWLWRELDRLAVAEHPAPRVALAARLSVPDRQLYRWLFEPVETASLDMVDWALCHAGEPGLLNELYPVDEQVAA